MAVLKKKKAIKKSPKKKTSIKKRKVLSVAKKKAKKVKKPKVPSRPAKKKKAKVATRKITSSRAKIKPKKKDAFSAVRRRGGKKLTAIDLRKPASNPIIEPSSHLPWESKATFNPTAVFHDGKIHIIYRAIGESDMSVLGHAKSNDGIKMDARSKMPIYFHTTEKDTKRVLPQILYSSGGGWGGGCEDPRATLIDDKIYLLYTAFDGWGSVRIGFTSIDLDDFIAGRFDWKKPVLISAPGQLHKNWALFPEKINGKYVILHALSPEIMVEYLDSLDELDGTKFITSVHQGSPLWYRRDGWIRGIGPAPIATKYGWLILYHATEPTDPGKYKLWAMILDKNDPTKVLYRGNKPVLSPDEDYENNGFKSGVVYSCGAVVKDKTLFVYYGGADTVSCVATADFEKFLKELITHKVPNLTKQGKVKA